MSAPPVPIIEHADVRRMLLAAKSYVEGGLALGLYCARLVDEEQTAEDADERARAHLLLEVLTPIAKAWPSQWGPVADDLAIQVHGGYGYTRDYPVEQFYRDNRLNPIHEGTNGIQALDLLGRKVVMQGGAGLALLGETIAATTARAAGTEWADFAADLDAAVARLGSVTATLWGAGDPDVALANAHVYLEAAGHLVVAWLWLEQVLATGTADARLLRRQAPGGAGTSGGGSCRACTTGSTCWSPWTARCSTPRRPGCDPPDVRTPRRSGWRAGRRSVRGRRLSGDRPDRLGRGVPSGGRALRALLPLVAGGGLRTHRDDQGGQHQEPQQGHGRPQHHLELSPSSVCRRRVRGGGTSSGTSCPAACAS